MGFYYQHIGRELFERDAPKSLGSPSALKRFSLENALANSQFVEVEGGVQIWGLPSGASKDLRRLSDGDYLMLLESKEFKYIGKVVYRWPEIRDDLSLSMWGEGKFGIVVALHGRFIDFPWLDFLRKLNFNENYHMRGKTMSLPSVRIQGAGLADENELFDWIVNQFGVA